MFELKTEPQTNPELNNRTVRLKLYFHISFKQKLTDYLVIQNWVTQTPIKIQE